MESQLRHVTADDWELLRAIRLAALADSPDAFGVTLAESRHRPESFWRERAAATASPTLLVLRDGEPVAMGGAFVPDDEATAYVWGMWTAPAARGQGHAGRILETLVAWARERDLDVRLHVTEGNDGARQLYVAHGFASTGEWQPLREGSALRVEELALDVGDVPRLLHTVLDTPRPRELAEFYRHLLGLRYRPGDEPPTSGPDDADWLVLTEPDGTRRLAFQHVPELRRTTWPEHDVPMQLHVDFTVASTAALDRHCARALALGAELRLDRRDDAAEPLVVLADPAGHPFCLFVG